MKTETDVLREWLSITFHSFNNQLVVYPLDVQMVAVHNTKGVLH